MWRPWHGWLPAVLPASAQTFRTADADLAATLSESGAASAERADVELATAVGGIGGAAPCAIVFLREAAGEGAGLPARVTARLGGVARVATGAAVARRRLQRLGYGDVRVVPFDEARRPQLDAPRLGDARALPLATVVAGRRGADGPTILEAAAAAGGEALAPARVGLSGVVLAIGEQRVLRVVLRAGEAQLRDAGAFLERLRAAGAPDAIAERIAWPVGAGEVQLARWVLEPRLPGDPAERADAALLGECVDFLATLFAAGVDEAPASLADAGHVVAGACPPELATAVAALGEHLEAELAGVPRGTAHGDFWADNLLADGGRLTGVVDWSGAGGGRLPLLDLLHLLASTEAIARDRPLGDAVVQYLLPLAERGGGPVIDGYCLRVGVRPEPPILRALVVAYWLDHVAHHLRSYADRAQRPAWLARNVHAVARVVV